MTYFVSINSCPPKLRYFYINDVTGAGLRLKLRLHILMHLLLYTFDSMLGDIM